MGTIRKLLVASALAAALACSAIGNEAKMAAGNGKCGVVGCTCTDWILDWQNPTRCGYCNHAWAMHAVRLNPCCEPDCRCTGWFPARYNPSFCAMRA